MWTVAAVLDAILSAGGTISHGRSRAQRGGARGRSRDRIALLAAQGVPGKQIAARVGCAEPTVVTWRRRYAESALAGLEDHPQPGMPSPLPQALGDRVLELTLTEPPTRFGLLAAALAADAGLAGEPAHETPRSGLIHAPAVLGAERAHLFDLARTAGGAGRRVAPSLSRCGPASSRCSRNRALTDLVGELATLSDAFGTRWAAHDVRLHHTGTKRFHHPVVGDLTVAFNAMELPADPRLTLTVYTAEPSSPTAEKLTLLASWAATAEQAQPDASVDTA